LENGVRALWLELQRLIAEETGASLATPARYKFDANEKGRGEEQYLESSHSTS